MVSIHILWIHWLECNNTLDNLLSTTFDSNLIVTEVVLVDIPDDEQSLYTVCRLDNGVDLMELIGLDFCLDVEINLVEVPADVVQGVALDCTCHFDIGIYTRYLKLKWTVRMDLSYLTIITNFIWLTYLLN